MEPVVTDPVTDPSAASPPVSEMFKDVDIHYTFKKNDDKSGGVHHVKAKGVGVDGRVVFDGDVALDLPKKAPESPKETAQWMRIAAEVVGRMMTTIEESESETDETAGEIDEPPPPPDEEPTRECIEREFFDTAILDREANPSEAPFRHLFTSATDKDKTNMWMDGTFPSVYPTFIHFIEVHFGGVDLTEADRLALCTGTTIEFYIGDKPAYGGYLRPVDDGKLLFRVWTGPLGVLYHLDANDGLEIPPNTRIALHINMTASARARIPKLQLLRAVLKVKMTRDLQ